jgi:hypothetical protein
VLTEWWQKIDSSGTTDNSCDTGKMEDLFQMNSSALWHDRDVMCMRLDRVVVVRGEFIRRLGRGNET